MATSRGGADAKRYMAQLPAILERRVLRGAARAAIGVVKVEAAETVASEEVREALVIKAPKAEPGRVTVQLTVKEGWPRSVANWLEYGTDAHIISIADDRDRQGMSISKINRTQKAGTLVIGGKPVGKIVHHPGARAEPFLRVSLDRKSGEAIAAAQGYINTRIGRSGVLAAEPEGDDA